MVEIEKSKAGLFTMKYNNRYIHSKYNPINEAQQLIKANIQLLSNPVILIYGLGLGYHIDEMVKNIDTNSDIYVFEYNVELIKYCKKINSNVFNYSNVRVIGSDNVKFYERLSECLRKVEDIIIHRPSLETIKETNERLYNLIDDYSLIKQSSDNNERLIKLGNENYEFNIKQNYMLINEFIYSYQKSDKPYVVTASGPSLDYDLDLLKENREKFNIISVGSSLRTIMERGIKPDAIVILDGQEGVKNQLDGYENEDIPLCFSAKASRWAVSEYKGPKYIFNVSEKDEFEICTEETVAVSGIDVAVKCGAEKIILLGQDLAFIENKSHTGTFETMYGIKDKGGNGQKLRTIKGVNGEKVITAQGYIRFKFKIERLIRRNPNIIFINCSKGAFIDGANHIDFKELLKSNMISNNFLVNQNDFD